jgi:hypothetical protein
MSLAYEINRVFGFVMQLMKPLDEKYNQPPKAKDSPNKLDTGLLNLKPPDTPKTK